MPINGATSKGSGGPSRTTFRPPWVKDNDTDKAPSPSKLKSVTKSDGVKKASPEAKENGQPTKPVAKPKEPAVKPKEPAVKPKEPVKGKEVTPQPVDYSKPKEMNVKLQSREVKVPIMTETRRPSAQLLKPRKKEPSPESEESESMESGTETSEESSEEDTPPPRSTLKKTDSKFGSRRDSDKLPRKDSTTDATDKPRNKFMQEVKLKPVLKKTPNVDELPERPKSMLLETPVLKKVVKPDPETLPEKPRNVLPEQPVLKKVVKKEAPIVPKTSDTEWNNFQLKAPPPPPPPGNMPPPPPPPPTAPPPPEFQKKPLSQNAQKTLDKLRTRARRRPDWSEMMAEVEQGKKLRHVECNDRSRPILTCKSMTKVKGQFIFETEKANAHNVLLQQIQQGIRLKPTKCNDRSRPVLEGLRKFRRQMTIEEQIQKSESRANFAEPPPEEEEDEMDDIDKLRDDLQSTKQMLALELRNKEAHERENKRLLARIANLEAELERERWSITGEPVTRTSTVSAIDESLVQSLKSEAESAQKQASLLEKKYQDTAEQLDKAKTEIEEQKRKIALLEKQISQGTGPGGGGSRRDSEAPAKDSSPEPEPEVSESDSEEDEATKEERRKRRLNREVKMLQTKLSRIKEKEKVARKERMGLKDAMKKTQVTLKEELKKYRSLQKEVDKMAKLMKDVDVDEDEEKDEEDAEEEEESEEEDESEESEESETEEESESESENEDAEDEKKKTNLEPRVKRHEGILAALKKGNYLHQANVDRLKDEVIKQREASELLQRDLDSVLSELG
ncbi:glutamic acid-rich protein isoform X2 [Lutzomyia longipalpis]|uniref:Putative rho-associated coiled-coil n=1 Tax=Lutzomyia longipalpis TaxID=7200 RepID=A0A7G3AW93_LUTLO|nr:glutamic acid-rich protein isoform X2 [Lutzomyia longipalpis]